MESNLYFLHPEVVTFTETAVNVDNAALKISKQTQNAFKLNLLQSNPVDSNCEGTENLFRLASLIGSTAHTTSIGSACAVK